MSSSQTDAQEAQSSSLPEHTPVFFPTQHTSIEPIRTSPPTRQPMSDFYADPPSVTPAGCPLFPRSGPNSHGRAPADVEQRATNPNEGSTVPLIVSSQPPSYTIAPFNGQHGRTMSGDASMSSLNHSGYSPQGVSLSSQPQADGSPHDSAGEPAEPLWSRGPDGEKVTFTSEISLTAKFQGGHYGKVMHIPRSRFPRVKEILMEECGWAGKLRCYIDVASANDKDEVEIYVCFNHLKDTDAAFSEVNNLVRKGRLDGAIRFHWIDQSKYGVMAPLHETERYDGQICVAVFPKDGCPKICHEFISTKVLDVAKDSGRVLSFAQASAEITTVFRLEFFDISAAIDFARKIGDSGSFTINDWKVAAWQMSEFLITNIPEKPGPSGYSISPTERSAWTFDRKGKQRATEPPNKLPRVESRVPSQTYEAEQTPQRPGRFGNAGSVENVRTPYTHSDDLCLLGSFSGRREGSSINYNPDMPEPFQGDPQTVLKWKIVRGLDVRTTLMLRNMPNGLRYQNMKEMLDAVSFGKYDFSYLRIDFSQAMNVGYGFVNFISVAALLEFVNRYGNKKWNPSEPKGRQRDAYFKYATTQGYDCLIDRFRNSAVMDEFPDYRPKVWYTNETAPNVDLIGTEKEFPAVNNESKKKRSRDNAGSIGLYTNNRRSERRGRYSQYDRGTSAQMREDAMFNNQMGQQVGFNQMHQNGQMGYNQMPQNSQMGFNNHMGAQNGQMGFYQMPPNGQVVFQMGQNGQFGNNQTGFNNAVGFPDQMALNNFTPQFPNMNSQAPFWPWSAPSPAYGGFSQFGQIQVQNQNQGQGGHQQYPGCPPSSSMDSSSDPFYFPEPRSSAGGPPLFPFQTQTSGPSSSRGFHNSQSGPSQPQFNTPMYTGGAAAGRSSVGGPVMSPPSWGAAAAAGPSMGANVPRTIPEENDVLLQQQQQGVFQMFQMPYDRQQGFQQGNLQQQGNYQQGFDQQNYQQGNNQQDGQQGQGQSQYQGVADFSEQFAQTSFFDGAADAGDDAAVINGQGDRVDGEGYVLCNGAGQA